MSREGSRRRGRALRLAALVAVALVLVWLGASLWSAPPEAFRATLAGRSFALLRPRGLLVGLLVPLVFFTLARSLTDLPWSQRLLGACLRSLFVVLLGLSLAEAVVTRETRRVATVFALDVSDSVSDEALVAWRSEVEAALAAMPAGDHAEVLAFADTARRVALDAPREGSAGNARHLPTPSELRAVLPDAERRGTRTARALSLAASLLPEGHEPRVVLFSDGRDTVGDAASEASALRARGARLDTVKSAAEPPGEVGVSALVLPETLQVGTPFAVRVTLHATRRVPVRVRLFQNGVLNGLDALRESTLEPGQTDLAFRSVARAPGEVTYRVEVEPLASDRFPENNRFETTVKVPGRPRVLIVDPDPASVGPLAQALVAQQLEVETRTPGALPTSLGELQSFDFLILSNTPRAAVPGEAQALLERFVRELGGGLLYAGGGAGWQLGEWDGAPFERLLPLRTETGGRSEQPGVAMTLVVDRSGSMNGEPLAMAKAACEAAVEVLQPTDQVAVVAFDTEPHRAVRMQPAQHRQRIAEEVRAIRSGGGTAIFPALDLAYQDLTLVPARRKHIILLTDGRSPTAGLDDLVRALTADGLTLTTVGLGTGVDADVLKSMAETGGGIYHAVPDARRLPRIFTRETERVLESATVDEWSPVVQTAPADFLRGIPMETAPLLRGYVETRFVGAPAEELLAVEGGAPLLARWRQGLGWVLAWSSDLSPRWSRDWLRWPRFGQLFGQLVREHLRSTDARVLPLAVALDGERATVTVDALTPDERFDGGLVSTLTVTGPAPRRETREVPLLQTAPGRYSASLQVPELGTYGLSALHRRAGPDGALIPVARSAGRIDRPYPLEYAPAANPSPGNATPAHEASLAALAVVGGGLANPTLEQLLGSERSVETVEPLWPWLTLGALGVFLLDVLVRRVRLFGRAALLEE